VPLGIADAGRLLRSGALTARGLLEACIARSDALDHQIGTYITRINDAARSAADQADLELSRGLDRGPLMGIPVAVKDNIATVDAPTTAQSAAVGPVFTDRADAPAVARLREAGAVITGKTSLSECAFGTPDSRKPFPVPRNPWHLDGWTGGSSSGNASGLAAGLFLAAIGTDTAGSVRIPASTCGVTGFRPTFGRIPPDRCLPFAPSYDVIGPMARTAEDCRVLYGLLAASAPATGPGDLSGDADGLRICVDRAVVEASGLGTDVLTAFEKALAVLTASGARVVEVSLPYFDHSSTIYRVGAFAEALSFHQPFLAARYDDYSVVSRVMLASAALSSATDYAEVQRARRVTREALSGVFERADLVASPMGPGFWLADVDYEHADRIVGAYFSGTANYATYWSNAGCPAISVPMGLADSGLPVGLQLAGRPGDDGVVLGAAELFQAHTSHHEARPSLVTELEQGGKHAG
jgi:aspartyl-tRNA(Asn)/glutamyl-tRNA(Gln) amidotransferase subunit A